MDDKGGDACHERRKSRFTRLLGSRKERRRRCSLRPAAVAIFKWRGRDGGVRAFYVFLSTSWVVRLWRHHTNWVVRIMLFTSLVCAPLSVIFSPVYTFPCTTVCMYVCYMHICLRFMIRKCGGSTARRRTKAKAGLTLCLIICFMVCKYWWFEIFLNQLKIHFSILSNSSTTKEETTKIILQDKWEKENIYKYIFLSALVSFYIILLVSRKILLASLSNLG